MLEKLLSESSDLLIGTTLTKSRDEIMITLGTLVCSAVIRGIFTPLASQQLLYEVSELSTEELCEIIAKYQ